MPDYRFGLIVNGNAGHVKNGKYNRGDYEELFQNQGLIRETQSINELDPVIKEFHEKGIHILFTYGGDGTHQKIYSHMIKLGISFPYVVPLKGGTMNMLVNDVNMNKKAPFVVKRILQLYSVYHEELPSFEKAILRVRLNENEADYGFYFGNGVIYNILKKYYENPSSVWNAVNVTVNSLLGSFIESHPYSRLLKRIKCRIFVDNKEFRYGKFLGIMLSTLTTVVFNMTPFIEISKKKNQFHFMGYSFRRHDLFRNFLHLAKGLRVKNPKVHPFVCKEVRLEYNSGYVIDGEVYDVHGPSTVTIDIGGYLRIPIIKLPD